MDNLLVSPRHHPGESLLFGWINRSKSKTFEKNTIELAEKNLDITEATIRGKLAELEAVARGQLLGDNS